MDSSSTSMPSNWSELPPDLTSSILLRLSTAEILLIAQRVCRSWRHVSKEPSLWRKIDMRDRVIGDYYFGNLCRNAVNRSEGGLVEINIGNIGSDSLLGYIADRSPNLRSLGVAQCFTVTNKGLVDAVTKFPLLEELELEVPQTWSKLNLEVIGHSCPKLKTLKLKLNSSGCRRGRENEDAFAIAESMPELCHLQLIGSRLTDTGLSAILDKCPHLEHLDLRQCININLSGDLKKRCSERIKEFRRPNDSTADYPYDFNTNSDLRWG